MINMVLRDGLESLRNRLLNLLEGIETTDPAVAKRLLTMAVTIADGFAKLIQEVDNG